MIPEFLNAKNIGESMKILGLVFAGVSFVTIGTFDNSFHYNMVGFGLCQFFSGLIILHLIGKGEDDE